MSLSDFSVNRPITTLMAITSVVVLGIIGLQRLPLTYIPEIESQRLSIQVPYASSSPEEIERNISRPIEEIMSTLPNLEKISSRSNANSARVSVEFRAGTDMDLASVEVRDRLDRVRAELPDDVERIRIRRWQSSDLPVYEFSLSWEGKSNDELEEVVDKVVVPKLQRIDGVANVELRGVDERQIIVDLDLERMRAHGVDFFNLSQSLRSNNLNFAGGTLIDGSKKYTVRTIGEFQSVDEIARVPIQGTPLVLSDVADVRFDFPEKTSFQRLNRRDAIVLRIYKASTANVIEVSRGVQEFIEELRQDPKFAGMDTQVFRDQSKDILSSLNNLLNAGLFGGILAVIVLYFFLRKFRSTVIIAMAIPISIMATFLIMYLLRLEPVNSTITINIVSLSGLMFAVGMLVDPAVVVLENIFRHKQEEGVEARKASIIGAKEVSVAVTSASMTTIIVFVPIVFMQSSGMGRFMADFGVSIISATLASLIISLTLVPLAASRLFTGKEKKSSKLLTQLSDFYGRAIVRVTQFPYSAIAVVIFIAVALGAWKLQEQIDRSWMPSTPAREMRLSIEQDRNFSLAEIATIMDSVEFSLMSKRDSLEISTISTNFSKRRSSMNIYFLPEEEGRLSTAELYEAVKAALPEFAGVEYKAGRRHGRGGRQEGVEVELHGPSTEVLVTYAEEIRRLFEDIEGIRDVDTSMERGDEEISVNVDRVRAQKYGLSSRRVAQSISSALSSRANSKFKTEQREVDIIMQLAEEDRVNIQQLENMAIANSEDEMVQLGSVADLVVKKGPESIERENRQTTISVFANTDQAGMWKVSMAINQQMAGIQLPPGYEWSLGRNWRMMRETEEDSNFAILMALLMVYIVMASLFESFVHPFTILLSVPFALIGVFIMFWWTSTNLTNMAYLGIIVVCGLVVNNGIILIDAINKLRRAGKDRAEAIRIGGRNRLRPILMTTLTTLIGLLPMVLPYFLPEYFGQQEGRAGMYAPVGIAVVGGLLTSTPLTLLLMPILYVLFDDASMAVRRMFDRIVAAVTRKKAVAEA